jgi:predicted DsbA family dithiol-disulfide isomerase
MTERIIFHFDALCPWCYMTSKWVHRLEELGEVEADWGIFSLEITNTGKSSYEDALEFRGARVLRTVMAVRDAAGSAAVGRFYWAVGKRTWDDTQDIRDADVVRGALEDVGLDAALHDKAMDDPTTWDRVVEEHNALVNRTRSFGVPTIQFDGPDGPAMFGPVISVVPDDGDAVELLRHVAWLTRYDNMSELKRDRTVPPDLHHARVRAAERERREAEAKAAGGAPS